MFDPKEFVEGCLRASKGDDGPRRVLDLMRSAVQDGAAISRAVAAGANPQAILDAPIFRSPELVVLNVTLPPRLASAPHDHRMWAVIGIYEGQEDNVFYRRGGARLEEASRRSLRAGETMLLGDDVIHAIANPLPTATRGLHVYGGDLLGVARSMWSPDTGEEFPYDARQFFRWCEGG